MFAPQLIQGGWVRSAAWKVKARDAFIGWSPERGRQRLWLIVNNSRFLILPHVRVAASGQPHSGRYPAAVALRLAGQIRHRTMPGGDRKSAEADRHGFQWRCAPTAKRVAHAPEDGKRAATARRHHPVARRARRSEMETRLWVTSSSLTSRRRCVRTRTQ